MKKKSIIIVVIIAVVVLIAVKLIGSYNSLVKLEAQTDTQLANVQVQHRCCAQGL